MRTSIFGFLFALFVLQACSKKDTQISTCEDCSFSCLTEDEADVISNSCIDNWECAFMVTDQSKVELNENNGIASGDKTVFQMINSTQGELSIADDEFTNILVFEIDESQENFSVQDGDLENLNVHFRRICYCIDTEFQMLSSGCIQGEKQSDGTWFVQANLEVSYSFGDIDVKIDAQFIN